VLLNYHVIGVFFIETVSKQPVQYYHSVHAHAYSSFLQFFSLLLHLWFSLSFSTPTPKVCILGLVLQSPMPRTSAGLELLSRDCLGGRGCTCKGFWSSTLWRYALKPPQLSCVSFSLFFWLVSLQRLHRLEV
jgi:hypothetical protein